MLNFACVTDTLSVLYYKKKITFIKKIKTHVVVYNIVFCIIFEISFIEDVKIISLVVGYWENEKESKLNASCI